MSHHRRLRLRLSSTNSQVQSAEPHSRIRPKRSLASSSAALASTAKRTFCSPSAALVHSLSIRSESLCTRSSPGACARAVFNADRRWDDTERLFAMPAKIETRRSRTAIALARAVAAAGGLRS